MPGREKVRQCQFWNKLGEVFIARDPCLSALGHDAKPPERARHSRAPFDPHRSSLSIPVTPLTNVHSKTLSSPWPCRTFWVFLIAWLSFANASLLAQSKQDDGPGFPAAPQIFPEDTIAYIRIDNVDEVRSDWGDSQLGRMLADPELRPFVEETYAIAAEAFDKIGEQFGVSLDELLAIPTGQVAAAAMPARFTDEQLDAIDEASADEDPESEEAIRRRIRQKRRRQNAIAGLFVIEAGENLDELLDLIERLGEGAKKNGFVSRKSDRDGITLHRYLPPRPGRPPLEYFASEGTLVFGIGHETASLALDHLQGRSDEPVLAQRSEFVSLLSRCTGEETTRPQTTMFLDPYHLIERLVKRGGAAGFVWPIIEDLGLKRLRGMAASSFRGGETFEDITHFHIGINPPRDGFFGVLRPEDVEEIAPPSWVSDDVTSYSTVGWNFPVTYDNAGKIVTRFMGGRPFEEVVDAPVQKAFDVSVRDDVLPNLSGRYVTVRWLQRPVKFNSMIQIHALHLSNPDAIRNVLEKVRNKQPSALRPTTKHGYTVYQLGPEQNRQWPDSMRPMQWSVSLVDDWILYSDSDECRDHLLQTAAGSRERLSGNVDYDIVTGQLSGMLAGETPFMVSYVRGEEFLRQGYELVKSDQARDFLARRGEENPLLAKLAELLRRDQLPDFDKLRKYFAPAGSFMYDEPGGIHWASYTLRGDD